MSTALDEKAKPQSVQELEMAVSADQKRDMRKNNDIVLVGSDHRIRKVPIPTSNPNDPLNWSYTRRIWVVITCCWFSVFSILSVSGLGTIMNRMIEMYAPERSAATVQGLSTWPGLTMALGCLALLPLSMAIGRRPVFILSVLGALGSSLGAGASNTFTGHFVARVFLGIFSGVTESLLPLIITDMTFLDEREKCFGAYWASQSGISAAMNISLSYIVAATNWRWFYWLFSISLAVGTILVLFCAPETLFPRSPMSLDGQVVYTDEFGVTHFLTDEEAVARFGHVEEHTEENIPRRSYLSTLKPFEGVVPGGWHIFFKAYVQIAESLLSPGVIYGLLISSISLGIGISMTIIYSTILVEEFHWDDRSVGLFNVGVIPASLAAMAYTEMVVSKTNIWLATRNNGVHKAEHHLVNLIVPCLAGIIAIVAIAVVSDKPHNHSAWGLIMGWTIYQFSFVSTLIVTTSFAAEAVPHKPGPAIVVILGGKSAVSFGATYGLVYMITKYSYMTTFMILLGIYIGIFLLGIPVFFFNHKWRSATVRHK